MVYLIDTCNGNTQIVKNHPRSSFYSDEWREVVSDNTPWFGEAIYGDKIVVMTYAKFGVLAERYKQFGHDFELILCDEIHSLPKFRSFRSKQGEANPHRAAQHRLEEIANNKKTLVVALSATPLRAIEKINCSMNFITVDSDVRQLETQETFEYTNKFRLLDILSPNERGFVFIHHITEMIKFEEQAKAKGFRTVCVWSETNQTYPMTDEQKEARNYIITNEELPPQYDMVILNASSETGINIRGQVDYIVVNSRQIETQIQVRGRYRQDLKRLYLWNNEFLKVPEKFLERKLFVEEKEELCQAICIHDEKWRTYKWPTVKNRIIEAGYCVLEDREKSRRYAIITE